MGQIRSYQVESILGTHTPLQVPKKTSPSEVQIDEADMKGVNLPVPKGDDLVDVTEDGIPRGYHAVAVIQGFQVRDSYILVFQSFASHFILIYTSSGRYPTE